MFDRLYDYRNDINHAGVRKSLSDPKTLIDGLNQLISQARNPGFKKLILHDTHSLPRPPAWADIKRPYRALCGSEFEP